MVSRAGGSFLLAMGALSLLLAAPAAGYGERVFDANPTLSGQTFPVFAAERVAQSFTAGESFVLFNVSLHVQNLPPQGDALNVTLQADAGGSPSGTPIRWSEEVSSGSGWRDFPMTPPVDIAAGTTYWIVATNGEPADDGYEWTHADADVVGGEAKRDTGSGWTAAGTDMSYLIYGLRLEPDVTLGLSVDRTFVDPGQTVNYTVSLNNTGQGVPPGAWLNFTFPAGLVYVSDTASSVGGVTSGTSSWTFPSLGNGARAFLLTARVQSPPTSYLNATARFEYADLAGAPRPAQTATASVRSTQVVVTPPDGGLWGNPLVLVLLVAAVVAPAAYWTWRSRRPVIEEVFVIHRSGILLHHLSRSLKDSEDVDKDALGGMLTVLQAFVKDSFRYGAKRDLNKLEFGSYRILIERGRDVYLAVASSKHMGDLSGRLRSTVAEIEGKYGVALANFRGRMDATVGIRDIVQKLVGRT